MIGKDEGSKLVYVDPKKNVHCNLGVIEPSSQFDLYDLDEGVPQED